MNYNQLTLTQWVQGFCRNVLEESDRGHRDIMTAYLSDLIEDASDFSWQGAKAAYAVLLCKMEHGSLRWDMVIELIAYTGRMPRNMHQVNKIGVEMTTKNLGFAKSFKQILVLIQGIMKPIVDYANISVLSA